MLVPVFNQAIQKNKAIKTSLVSLENITREMFEKAVVKEVKIAYYNYLKSEKARELFEATLELVNENLRTTESLSRNHQITLDAVFTAQAQVEEVKAELINVEKDREIAKAYFNFLLNKPLDSDIQLSDTGSSPFDMPNLDVAQNEAAQKRLEFKQIDQSLDITNHQIQLNKGNFLPELNLVLDYGIQGEHYRLSKGDDFLIGSMVLSWKLFDRSNRFKTEQAIIERESTLIQKSALEKQIDLETISAYYELESSRQTILLAEAEIKASEQAFKLINKKYGQGQSNLVEFKKCPNQFDYCSVKRNYRQL